MQSLIRSKSAGVTGGRGTAGAGPGRDLLHQQVAPPGRTYLTYRWRVKQGEGKNGAQAKNVAMHLCVCLITLI